MEQTVSVTTDTLVASLNGIHDATLGRVADDQVNLVVRRVIRDERDPVAVEVAMFNSAI